MADEPGRTDRREDRYEVAGRLQTQPGPRGRLWVVVVALAVVIWAGATLGDRVGGAGHLPGRSSVPGPVTSGGPPGGSSAPTADAGYLPALDAPQSNRNAGRLPIVLGGLAWLDLSFSRIETALDLSLTQWPLALPGGDTACVCIGTQPTGGRELLTTRFGPSDAVEYANAAADWLPAPVDLTIVDAAPTPDGLAALVASVVPDDDGYRLRLERLPLASADSAGRLLSSIPVDLGPFGDPAGLILRLLVAPDGSRVRISVLRPADELIRVTALERSWTVPIDASGFGAFAAEPPAPADLAPATCRGSALATPTAVVALCVSEATDPEGRSQLLLRIDDAGRSKDVDLWPIFANGAVLGWQVDGSAGVVYVWDALAHRVARVVAASGEHRVQVLGDGAGGDLPSVAPPPTPPAGPPPEVLAATLWQPTASARDATSNLLAGSMDGRWLYAGGLALPTGDSTGIWVLDSATLLPVAHWPAVAAYQSLALSPDGGFLIGVGGPSSSELSRYGNHGPQLVLHDPADGSVIAIHRSLALRLGGEPSLLPPGPPGPAG